MCHYHVLRSEAGDVYTQEQHRRVLKQICQQPEEERARCDATEERSPPSQINRFRLSRLLRRKSRVCVSVTSSSSCGIATHRFLSLAVK